MGPAVKLAWSPTLRPDRGTAERSCTPSRRGWRLPGSQETIVGSISTCSLRLLQWYHDRVVPSLAWHPARESDVENQVLAGDSWGARRLSLAQSLRARRCRLDGAMYEFGCCRVSSRAAVCCGV